MQWSDEFLGIRNKRQCRESENDEHTLKIKELIEEVVGEEILDYFEKFIDVTSKETIVVKDYRKSLNKEKLFLRNC